MTRALFIVIMLFIAASITPSPAHADTDVVYKRVIDSKTIRCGYAQWPPFFSTDPNTKQPKGLLYELVGKIGLKLGLKIEWTTEIGWGDVPTAIKANKFDMFCVAIWPNSGLVRTLTLSKSFLYNPVYLWARPDDHRFDHNYARANAPDVTVTGQEGDVTSETLNQLFPNAKKNHISAMEQSTDILINIVSKKADITVEDVPFVDDYIANNPGTLRRVPGPPAAVFQLVMPMAQGEYQLKNMIDTVLTDFINDGTITALIKKYDAKDTYAPRPDVDIQKERMK